jgi:hypothetical protein
VTRTVAVGIAVAVLAVAVIAAWLIWPRGSTPVTLEEARADLEERRQADAQADANAAAAAAAAGAPATGVYEYTVEGIQSVGFGGVTDEDRAIPETVNVGIDATDVGCFEITLNLVDQHVERTTLCDDAGIVSMARHRKEMEFGALSPTIDMTCDPAVVVNDRTPGSRTDLTCDMDVSVAVVETTGEATGVAVVGTVEEITVGAETRSALPVEMTYTMDGGMAGSWTQHYWLDQATLLPLRIERTMDLSGPASISETSTLMLTDLEPVP